MDNEVVRLADVGGFVWGVLVVPQEVLVVEAWLEAWMVDVVPYVVPGQVTFETKEDPHE